MLKKALRIISYTAAGLMLAAAWVVFRMASEHYGQGISWDELMTGQEHTWLYLWGALIIVATVVNQFLDDEKGAGKG